MQDDENKNTYTKTAQEKEFLSLVVPLG